ncbi:MAG: type I CRISPR-associated protein Cas7 [Candidatus Heimdallarchaeaceae archaeon]|jgi:CRISPR-associated protein Csd2
METNIKRATCVLVIEAVNSNPNGDPDRENDPRHRDHNTKGEITGVSVKSKMRELMSNTDGPVFEHIVDKLGINRENFNILERKDRNRKEIKEELKDIESFKRKYWDARILGSTFLEKGENVKYKRAGVVHATNAISIAPIRIERLTITNKAGVEEGKDCGMAPLGYRVVEHGVYCMQFFVNPSPVNLSGCTTEDIEVFKTLIPFVYDHTRSFVRPDVRIRHAWYIEHENSLGSVPDFMLFDILKPRRKGDDPNKPSTCWDDYDVPTELPSELAELKFEDLMGNCY